jgi:hypothetical protein
LPDVYDCLNAPCIKLDDPSGDLKDEVNKWDAKVQKGWLMASLGGTFAGLLFCFMFSFMCSVWNMVPCKQLARCFRQTHRDASGHPELVIAGEEEEGANGVEDLETEMVPTGTLIVVM